MTQGQNLGRWRYLLKLVFFAVGIFSLYVTALAAFEVKGDYLFHQRVDSWSQAQGIMIDNVNWRCPVRPLVPHGANANRFDYVRYTFIISNVSYYGNRYSKSGLCSLRLPDRHDFIARHIKGLSVNVLYNPANPNESFLSNSPVAYQGLGMTILYSVIAFFSIRGAVYT
jgi:hypothetical protein